jgi:hypothetical protein
MASYNDSFITATKQKDREKFCTITILSRYILQKYYQNESCMFSQDAQYYYKSFHNMKMVLVLLLPQKVVHGLCYY